MSPLDKFLARFVSMQIERNRLHELAGPLGVLAQELAILAAIYNAAESAGILACDLRICRSEITRFGDRLEKRGYIERTHSTGDRRSVMLALLPKGREAVECLQRELAMTR